MSRGAAAPDLAALAWPAPRLGEAIAALAQRAHLGPRAVEIPVPPPGLLAADAGALGDWLAAAATWLGIEAEPVESPYADIGRLIRGAAPALLPLAGPGPPRFLALLGARGPTVTVLGPDAAAQRVPAAAVQAALCAALEAPLLPAIDRLLADAGVPPARRPRARTAILRAQLSARQIDGGWLLRLPPGADLARLARQARFAPRLLALGALFAATSLLEILAWWMVGQGALQGRLDGGWLLGWGLVVLSQVPFTLLATWTSGQLAIDAGALLKARLLAGALRLDPGAIRQAGVGQLLGRVFESETVEALALSSGFSGLAAGIGLLLACVILGLGAGGLLHVALLLAWLAVVAALGRRFYRDRQAWTQGGPVGDSPAGPRAGRLGLTHDLIERMIGQRTRLAQELPERWHAGEDVALDHYLALSAAMDRAAVLLTLAPRGWLILGILGLAPAFVAARVTAAPLAIGLGGILLAYRALGQLTGGLSALASTAIAWQQVGPLFHAAGRPGVPGLPDFALAPTPAAGPGPAPAIVAAHDLSFRYHDRAEPVLHGCTLQIAAGDRLLLEGPSGGGKSTLAALLTGLRRPDAGLLLCQGLDRQTLGADGWRRRVGGAPQFHENHVLAATFAFNLLMGRRWPPAAADLALAETICRELGLGDLLDRMPAGMLQMVGETGWQLSHGERSRLYIARALLQGTDLMVLDESFAALDPETLQRCLRCVLDRAPTLLVIAHP